MGSGTGILVTPLASRNGDQGIFIIYDVITLRYALAPAFYSFGFSIARTIAS